MSSPTAFIRDPEAESDENILEVMRASILEAAPQRFTSLPGAEVVPTWSPDGTEIAFRWDGDETRPRGIYRKRIGGGDMTLVRYNGNAGDYPIDWTPDGTHLIVITGAGCPSEPPPTSTAIPEIERRFPRQFG